MSYILAVLFYMIIFRMITDDDEARVFYYDSLGLLLYFTDF